MARKKGLPGKPPSERAGRKIPAPSRRVGNTSDPVVCYGIHEGGHAVAASVLGMDLRRVGREFQYLTATRARHVSFTDVVLPTVDPGGRERALARIVQIVAGPIAEATLEPDAIDRIGCREDMDSARKVAASFLCQRDDPHPPIPPGEPERHRVEIDALINEGIAQAKAIVKKHWSAISAVAVAITADRPRILTGEDVAAIVAGGSIPPRPTRLPANRRPPGKG